MRVVLMKREEDEMPGTQQEAVKLFDAMARDIAKQSNISLSKAMDLIIADRTARQVWDVAKGAHDGSNQESLEGEGEDESGAGALGRMRAEHRTKLARKYHAAVLAAHEGWSNSVRGARPRTKRGS